MSGVSVLQPGLRSGPPGQSAYQLAGGDAVWGSLAAWQKSFIGPAADPTALNQATAQAAASATNAGNQATNATTQANLAGGSAQAAATSAAASAGSANAATASQTSAASSASAASASASLSQSWAMQASGTVAGTTSLSSFAYAQLSQAWASQSSGTVDGTSYSAKYYALLAAAWAYQPTGTVDGTHYSAYYWAQQAAQSASQAAGSGVSPVGASFTVGHLAVFAKADGTQIKDLGAPAAVATSGSASDLTVGTLPAAQLPASVAFLASPTFTGSPAAPTPAAGDSSTRLATTNFVAAAISAIPPAYPITGVSPKSAAYTIVASDRGAILDLTGSFALTLPAASGGSASSPLYFHYRKRDGSGACTLALSGSDTWDDGTTAAKYVYQETGTLVSLGGGIWRFAPGTRQRGYVKVGSFAASSGASAVSVTSGFGDSDIDDVVVNIPGYTPSTSSALFATLTQGGSSAASTQCSTSSAGTVAVTVAARNVGATAANGAAIVSTGNGIAGSSSSSGAGAITALNLAPSSGTISSMIYIVWVVRR